MDLKELLGDAYKEDITAEEVKAIFKKQLLATGEYENKGKSDADKKRLETQIADLQKELDGKMTVDEKKQAQDKEMQKLVEKLQKELAQSNMTISKKTASGYLSGLKTKAGIKDDDTDFDDFISNIAFEDNDKTDKISKYIANMVSNAYETGKSDAIKDKLGKLGSFKDGQEGGSEEKGAFGKELAESTKVDSKTPDFFKKE
jgi:hypothetical protein